MWIKSERTIFVQIVLLWAVSNGSTVPDKEHSDLHKNLNLKPLTIISPPPCDPELEVEFLYVIHTAPDHSELRNTLRRSWATSNPVNNNRRVFLIGRSNATLEKTIINEHKSYGDIFMYDKVDAYRNMTIKVSILRSINFSTLQD